MDAVGRPRTACGATQDRPARDRRLIDRGRQDQEIGMYRQGVGDFKYYGGISSLAQIATRRGRVGVLNILGGESSEGTPVGHEDSGRNGVFGASPGGGGQGL